jgi:hypothetical protein
MRLMAAAGGVTGRLRPPGETGVFCLGGLWRV